MYWEHQAQPSQFYFKKLLEDLTVEKDQIDILEGLLLTLSSGDDIIIDLRANCGKKSSYDEFWDMNVIYLYFFSSHSFLFQNNYI